MTSIQEDIMKESFRDEGVKHGYERVNAEYTAYRDFKVRWTRTNRWIEFHVSDYLSDAPKEVIDSLVGTLYSKICGSDTIPYTKAMRDWATSETFVYNKQPIYLKRSRGLTKSSEGKHRDLKDSFRRLIDKGLVKEPRRIFLSWTNDEYSSRVGYCSTLMEVIAISSAFDDPFIPDDVLDYAVYHEYLMISEGKKHFGEDYNIDTVELERKFPGWKEAEEWIGRMGLTL